MLLWCCGEMVRFDVVVVRFDVVVVRFDVVVVRWRAGEVLV
mgnify:FL=1